MLNEAGFIEPCLDGFLAQTYDNIAEILVIDGGSTDGSREAVQAVATRDGRVRLVDNPKRQAAAAANIGIEEATGELLCFLSAHGVPTADYVEVAVDVLVQTGAVGVGGRYRHEGLDGVSSAIGMAMASPFGMASPHRSAAHRSEVDTISHPVFVRQALVDVGGYDESLPRNEDYETNFRLRRAGGRLVFTPEISSVYRPRRSLGALASQFWDYGWWKAEVMARHPDSVRLRHLVPPVAVAGGAVALGAAVAGSWAAQALVVGGSFGYAALLGLAVARERPGRSGASTLHFACALPVIHLAWGSGLLGGAVAALRRRWRRSNGVPGS